VAVSIAALLFWTEPKSKQVLDRDVVDEAWHEGLDDAYDIERRQFEERKRVEDDEHRRVATANR
jgi:hypothetical protein